MWPHFSAGTCISEALPWQTRSSSLTACLNKAGASFHQKRHAAFLSRHTVAQILWNRGSRTVGPAVFLIDREAKKGGEDPTSTLRPLISAAEWLAFRHWESVWSRSVKTYTPTERRKMKDIFSFSSTLPKHSVVNVGSRLQHPKCAIWATSKSLYSFALYVFNLPKERLRVAYRHMI